MAKKAEHLTVEERRAVGKAARQRLPREAQAEWDPVKRTVQPLDLLVEQAETRVAELVPIRYGRMAASSFAYFRGAALPMAADLATGGHSGLMVQMCGDAHLANFGGFASPEREMLFDLNDFDETLPGPFEWDVKRLAASLVVAARSRGFDTAACRQVVMRGLLSYRDAMRAFALMPSLQVWYARLDVPTVLARWSAEAGPKVVKQFQRAIAKAETKDQMQARTKLTRLVDGRLRFVSNPPLLVPVEDLFGDAEAEAMGRWVDAGIAGYRRTLLGERRRLLENYQYADLARKVVGVGSVGTRCWVALMVGRDNDDTLILQVKEAETSVFERFTAPSDYKNHGQRVVEGQRLMQAASDLFLGWHRVAVGVDGNPHDYYFRQLWDWKLSANIDAMTPEVMRIYAELCGWTLARGHARSGDTTAIASYMGGSDVFCRAVADFAAAYADQNEKDHTALTDAIAAGRVTAWVVE
ncbi:MAG TPA: DUF2252 domain-containing protein [Acidimicrobiales bacterium]|nr:DUF2252 domain-containing protein [Acidimicrobiales bacterium]